MGPHQLRLAARLLLWTGALFNSALHSCKIKKKLFAISRVIMQTRDYYKAQHWPDWD